LIDSPMPSNRMSLSATATAPSPLFLITAVSSAIGAAPERVCT
jgi:hypothetical protein